MTERFDTIIPAHCFYVDFDRGNDFCLFLYFGQPHMVGYFPRESSLARYVSKYTYLIFIQIQISVLSIDKYYTISLVE